MPTTGASAAFRTATALEAMRRATSVAPEEAPYAAEAGRARFYDALAGRLGLPGSAVSSGPSDSAVSLRADLQIDPARTDVAGVRRLAGALGAGGWLDRDGAGLLGLGFGGLSFAADPVFQASPLALFARGFAGQALGGLSGWPSGGASGGASGAVWDWIAEHRAQHQFLVQEGGDPQAIRSSEAVLDQLHRLRAEQALYAAADRARDAREGREPDAGRGLFSGPFQTLALPPQALALLAAR
ncbi:MAG: hypothetical protein NXI21_18580 [Alphaproteobacteria bacterium]|nr:hypothetical protein [Alphaproteobacteria bacterium]